MTKVSSSPDRHYFQKEGYVKRQNEKNEPIDDSYLDLFEKMIEQAKAKFDNPENCKNNLEYDLLTTDWILSKVRSNKSYAQNIYAALCNNYFQKIDTFEILKDNKWSCSWRYAGGIVADMRQEGDYIDWYCSGINNDDCQDELFRNVVEGYVSESIVTEEVKNDLLKLGWRVLTDENYDE